MRRKEIGRIAGRSLRYAAFRKQIEQKRRERRARAGFKLRTHVLNHIVFSVISTFIVPFFLPSLLSSKGDM